MAKPEPVIVVIPLNAPLVSIAVPSVMLPPVIAPDPVIVVAPDNAPLVSVAVPSVKLPPCIISETDKVLTPVSYTHLTLPTILLV